MKNEGRGADSDGNRNLALLQKANKKKITTKLREKIVKYKKCKKWL